MTFAIALVLPQACMVAADRKLSSNLLALSRHKAIKICRIETTDAHGLMTYAGAGATLRNAKPFDLSHWIASVLRGQMLNFEQAMATIAIAATEQRLTRFAKNHTFMFAGFVRGKPLVHLVTAEQYTEKSERVKSAHGIDYVGVNFFPEAGKGGAYPIGTGRRSAFALRRTIYRATSSLKKSVDSRIHRYRAMALLAQVVRIVSKHHADVSPDCVCCWADQLKTGEVRSYNEGGHLLQQGESIPAVAGGWDMLELWKQVGPVIKDHMREVIKANIEGRQPPPLDEERMRAATSKVDVAPKRSFVI